LFNIEFQKKLRKKDFQKDVEIIPQKDGRYRAELKLFNSSINLMTGNYTCVASNTEGKVSADFFVGKHFQYIYVHAF